MRRNEAIAKLEKMIDQEEYLVHTVKRDYQRVAHSVRAQAFTEALVIVRRIDSD